ncbi:MAG TPA: hypothetical protein VEZ70_11290 [Allosphingosinicella sp.]|nr:hypothetical protein [Allosphingosinicella sp.]
MGGAGAGGEEGRLRAAAVRLAAEMEAAGVVLGAAYARLAGDALEGRLPEGWGREAGVVDGDGVEFEADEHGRVWMIREGVCHAVGRVEAVCGEMRRFLNGIPPK